MYIYIYIYTHITLVSFSDPFPPMTWPSGSSRPSRPAVAITINSMIIHSSIAIIIDKMISISSIRVLVLLNYLDIELNYLSTSGSSMPSRPAAAAARRDRQRTFNKSEISRICIYIYIYIYIHTYIYGCIWG